VVRFVFKDTRMRVGRCAGRMKDERKPKNAKSEQSGIQCGWLGSGGGMMCLCIYLIVVQHILEGVVGPIAHVIGTSQYCFVIGHVVQVTT
jgi:hypothetical protein